MATSKSRRSSRSRSDSSTSRTSSARRSLAARTGRTISDRPVASAAIGTGLVAGIVAAVAGFRAFKRSGKSFGEFSDDTLTSVRTRATETSERVKDGLADAKTRIAGAIDRRKDGLDAASSQTEIAEEALTLKETGKARGGKKPADPVVETQTKAGAISY